ncbi:MAG: helix-turn-helix transcriptional regulator [Planctomycetes bacterium]|nr:helix-turn-helix transcriptional regulator [Planctomycetota bacterium]
MAKIINDFYHADNPQFYVHAIDSMEPMPASVVHRPEAGLHWLFIYFLDPVVVHDQQQKAVRSAQPALFIWPPHVPHFLGNQDQRWSHSWMHISGSLVDSWMQELGIPTYAFIDTLQQAEHQSFFHDMVRELGEYQQPDMHLVQNLFENWLRKIKRSLHSLDKNDSRLLQIKRFIDARFAQNISLQNLADEAGMSASHFSSSFKKQFKSTSMDFVINRRLEEATYLLGDHMLRIKEIARRVGYEDEFHFSRLFKKKYGVSPKFYRKK